MAVVVEVKGQPRDLRGRGPGSTNEVTGREVSSVSGAVSLSESIADVDAAIHSYSGSDQINN